MELLKYIFAASIVSLVAACGSDDHAAEPPQPVSILATAQAAPDLSSLVAAVQFASDNNDISLKTPITPVQGKTFVIQATAGGVAITDGRNRVSNIVATDVLNSNGAIQVIDKVILPPL